MKLEELKIQNLKSNKVQPPHRVQKSLILPLLKSIKTHGLLSPIHVTKTGIIVDGHRRLECLKELGYEKVPAIIYNGEMTDKTEVQVFRYLNEYNLKLKAIDFISVYLKGGEVPINVLKQIAFISEKLGRSYLRKFVELNISPYYPIRFWKFAKRIGMDSRDEFGKFLFWIKKNKQATVIVYCEKNGFNKTKLLKAIKGNKPFKI